MVTDEKWKMAVNREGQPYLLFDLEADPDELNNLAGIDDYRDVETQLRLRMFERILEAQ
jgi:arylsulfatase A-like enzyme